MKPERFTVQLSKKGIAKSASFPKLPKYGLYVIRSGNKVIRIGETASGSARLKKGFREPLRRVIRNKDRKNYIAYSWRNKYRGRRLSVDYFSLGDDAFSDAKLRRAVEAEVTFQFRLARKKWPEEMSEIHFLEQYQRDPRVVDVTKEILEHYGHEYNSSA